MRPSMDSIMKLTNRSIHAASWPKNSGTSGCDGSMPATRSPKRATLLSTSSIHEGASIACLFGKDAVTEFDRETPNNIVGPAAGNEVLVSPAKSSLDVDLDAAEFPRPFGLDES